MIEIHITCKNNDEAKKIAQKLLELKLVACANILPVKSFFSWKNKVVFEEEELLILKSKATKEKDIIKIVKELHSYSVPVIVTHNVNMNKDACVWINEVTD